MAKKSSVHADDGSSSRSKSSSSASSSSSSSYPIGAIVMWLLNGCLLVCSYFALQNWTAVNWLTGSYGWAALLEISALLLLLYLFLAGLCLFGWPSRVERSFVHLADSPQLLSLFGLAMPFLAVGFFGCLALLALANLRHTSLFVAAHAEAVFAQARAAGEAFAKRAGIAWTTPKNELSRDDFFAHICSLPSFNCAWMNCTLPAGSPISASSLTDSILTPSLKECRDALPPDTPEDDVRLTFKKVLSTIFDSMVTRESDPNPTQESLEYATVGDVYHGVQVALRPYKTKFGWSVAAIALICLLQFSYYWYRFKANQMRSNQQQQQGGGGGARNKAQDKEAIPFIGP